MPVRSGWRTENWGAYPGKSCGLSKIRCRGKSNGVVMVWATSASTRTLRFCILGVSTLCAIAFTSDTAHARRHGHHRARHSEETSSYTPPFSSIIVDANSGATLQANNADGSRHPASLTKIMTLYMLFERLESGKITLDTQMEVTERAAEQAPTKLGLRPGQTIRVEDAIKGLVTRSANDAAVVISEALAGDEDEFAKLMTRKARALGMSRTTYKNASGLPDDDQVTTARDQSILGRAIQDRFPIYYRYFSTNDFHFRGNVIRNHNHLLGQIEGVDGIKTGYTRASGFNLVTSIRRGNRHLVGVVMGGRSGSSRDATMRSLLTENLERGATRRTVAAITERAPANYRVVADATEGPDSSSGVTESRPSQAQSPAQNTAPASVSNEKPMPLPMPKPAALAAAAQPAAKPDVKAEAKPAPLPLTSGVLAQQLPIIPGSSEPMTPVRVKTLQIKAGPVHLASADPAQATAVSTTASVPQSRFDSVDPTTAPPSPRTDDKAENRPEETPPQNPAFGTGHGVLGTLTASALQQHAATMAYAAPQTTAPNSAPQAVIQAPPPVVTPQPQVTAQPHAKTAPHIGWIIQVGALDSESEAKQRLDAAQGSARSFLGKADPFTETFVSKGGKNLYRARFAGLDKDSAEAACHALKRSEISCITIKN
jgi:D-alanyl-D-alanine carboxypeptidase